MSKERNTLGKFKKQCMVAVLAAAMMLGATGSAQAIDFKASGQWLMGFGVADKGLVKDQRLDGVKETRNNGDQFQAAQRIRLQLDAVASEALSGTVYLTVSQVKWGQEEGGELGSNQTDIKVKAAYLDWVVPNTDAKVRMGLQGFANPNAAGGASVIDTEVAAVVANFKFNDNVGVTAAWLRPFNDNFNGVNYTFDGAEHNEKDKFLDNMDLFMLSLPLTFDGFEVTPWAMYGAAGKHTWDRKDNPNTAGRDIFANLSGIHSVMQDGIQRGYDVVEWGRTSKSYQNIFWAGLPVVISAWDPLNVEFDFTYGYAEQMGRVLVQKHYDAFDSYEGDVVAASTERKGWVAKALVEYKMDWGVPGIFGWYGSGDDASVKNGSERLPHLDPANNFTSFLGDGNLAWDASDSVDLDKSYSGTWGIGLQLRDMSFMEDLKHTFRVAYFNGTNSTGMVKYMKNAVSWEGEYPYLTTADSLLEFNLVNQYQMYENLEVNFELGYIANFMDEDVWKKAGVRDSRFTKQDAWKAQLVFAYSF